MEDNAIQADVDIFFQIKWETLFDVCSGSLAFLYGHQEIFLFKFCVKLLVIFEPKYLNLILPTEMGMTYYVPSDT